MFAALALEFNRELFVKVRVELHRREHQAVAEVGRAARVGAIIVYYVGLLLGRERTRAIMMRVPLVTASDFDRAEAWFARYVIGGVALAVPVFVVTRLRRRVS